MFLDPTPIARTPHLGQALSSGWAFDEAEAALFAALEGSFPQERGVGLLLGSLNFTAQSHPNEVYAANDRSCDRAFELGGQRLLNP